MTTSEKATKIDYRCATEADLPRVVELKRKVWGGISFENWRRRWVWQFVDHPRRKTGKFDSNFILAFIGGELVGGIGFMPTSLSRGDEELECAFGCDLFIDPAAQGHGLGKSLVRQVLADYPDSLWMNYDLAGARSYENRGFAPVRPVNFLALAIDPGALFRERGRHLPAALVGWTSPLVSAGIRRRMRSFSMPPGITAAEVDTFDEVFDRFRLASLDRGLVRPCRDAAYLGWRYRASPFGNHRVISARRNGELLGFVVYRAHDTSKGRLGVVLELEAGPVPGLAPALISSAVLELIGEGVSMIKAIATDPARQSAFRRLGFMDTRRTPYLYVSPGTVERRGLPVDANAWSMSMGDCDLDYS